MIINTLTKRPLIELDDMSVFTFANEEKPMDIYDFDFKSFAEIQFESEDIIPQKMLIDPRYEKLSTHDEDVDLELLVSMIRVPARTQRFKSVCVADKSLMKFDLLNSKRDINDFTSELNDYRVSGTRDCYWERNKRLSPRLLDDSIDDAIAYNRENTSFDKENIDCDLGKLGLPANKASTISKKSKRALSFSLL